MTEGHTFLSMYLIISFNSKNLKSRLSLKFIVEKVKEMICQPLELQFSFYDRTGFNVS